jgi:hypothetical protein
LGDAICCFCLLIPSILIPGFLHLKKKQVGIMRELAKELGGSG